MNDRLRAEERYTRKDSIIFVNTPFDARKCNDVITEALKLFQSFFFLKIHVPFENIKACHILRNTGNALQVPSVICKFFYFDKNNVYAKRWHLKKNHPINRKTSKSTNPQQREASIANEQTKVYESQRTVGSW